MRATVKQKLKIKKQRNEGQKITFQSLQGKRERGAKSKKRKSKGVGGRTGECRREVGFHRWDILRWAGSVVEGGGGEALQVGRHR